MTTLPAAEFLRQYPAPACLNHHLTGPPGAQLPEESAGVRHVEGQILHALAYWEGGPVLEIGGDCGVSTRYIEEGLRRWPAGEAHVVTVDPIHRWLAWQYSPRIIQVAGRSTEVSLPGDFLWAFIDGSHQYGEVRADIDVALAAGCEALVFHDTSPNCRPATSPGDGSDARQAVLAWHAEDGGQWALTDIETPCGLIYARIEN